MAPVRTFKRSNPESHLNTILTKTANSVLSDVTHVIWQAFHFFHTVSRYAHTCIIMYCLENYCLS